MRNFICVFCNVFTSFNYFLIEYGSGMKMFSDAKILDAEGILDVELFENYIACNDKESFEKLFYTLTGISFEDYINRCEKI